MSSAIHLNRVTKWFASSSGARYIAVKDITLSLESETFLAVVGPSGCGKSTLLNMTAGLIHPSEGSIEVYGARLNSLNRRASYMFQQDALLPWKTVLGNVLIGLQFHGSVILKLWILGERGLTAWV